MLAARPRLLTVACLALSSLALAIDVEKGGDAKNVPRFFETPLKMEKSAWAPAVAKKSKKIKPQSKPADLAHLRLYIPTPELNDRFGKAPPLGEYIKALEKRTGEILANEKRPKAKGLLITVGIKSKNYTRVWCEPVEGEAPAKLLKLLEKELAKIEAFDLKKAPVGFAMAVSLFGQKPDKYPEFPQIWLDAARKHKKLLAPPDDLFKIIWPE